MWTQLADLWSMWVDVNDEMQAGFKAVRWGYI